MERGPVPPHERTWRHPSELAAEERSVLRAEAAAPSTRVFALTTGTIGLLAVGVLILTVSPRRHESPVAISATTTPATAVVSVEAMRAPTGLSSPASTSPAVLTESVSVGALATPIGDGRFALVTGLSLAGERDPNVDVRFASGRVMAAEVVSSVDESVVLVALDHTEPGHDIARHEPAGHDLVTVLASPPITVAYADVDTLAVLEGTPVFDGDGALVGLCTRSGSRVRVVAVNEDLVGATSADR